jgi:maltose O-acetyltransferase
MRNALMLAIYYLLAYFLPDSVFPFGNHFQHLRECLCRRIFSCAGTPINIESRVYIADGKHISIGSRSGLGTGCRVYGAVIGNDVMIGPGVLFLKQNHSFDDITRPIGGQGSSDLALPIVEDEAWVGERAIILPGRRIGRGAIVGAGAVVTRDIQPLQIVGGNPARVIGHRGDTTAPQPGKSAG